MKKRKRKSNWGRNLGLIIMFALIGLGLYQANKDDLFAEIQSVENIQSESAADIDDVEPVDKEKQRALESIMTRADFQRQQELRAEEIYINEGLDELAARRSKIITGLDSEKAELDSQLENVRHELVSFGSAPMLKR
jgi:chromosome segregation ATPase